MERSSKLCADEPCESSGFLVLTQQTLVKLGESRAAAGLLLDQLRGLQVELAFAATVTPLGGALELRWQSVCRQTELETRHCRDRRDSMSRWESCSLAVKLHTHRPARLPPVSYFVEDTWVFYLRISPGGSLICSDGLTG